MMANLMHHHMGDNARQVFALGAGKAQYGLAVKEHHVGLLRRVHDGFLCHIKPVVEPQKPKTIPDTHVVQSFIAGKFQRLNNDTIAEAAKLKRHSVKHGTRHGVEFCRAGWAL